MVTSHQSVALAGIPGHRMTPTILIIPFARYHKLWSQGVYLFCGDLTQGVRRWSHKLLYGTVHGWRKDLWLLLDGVLYIIYKLWQLLSKLRTNEWPHESRTGYLLSLLWLMIDGDTWGAAGSAWYSYWPGPGPPACPCPLHPLPVISCSPCNLTTDYYNIPWLV